MTQQVFYEKEMHACATLCEEKLNVKCWIQEELSLKNKIKCMNLGTFSLLEITTATVLLCALHI